LILETKDIERHRLKIMISNRKNFIFHFTNDSLRFFVLKVNLHQ
jgi:hypothetical protein